MDGKRREVKDKKEHEKTETGWREGFLKMEKVHTPQVEDISSLDPTFIQIFFSFLI